MRSSSAIRLLTVAATAAALSAASVTVASAAPQATTKSNGTVTLKISSTKPRIFRSDNISGTAPTWAKTVTVQRREHGTSKWTNLFKDTVTKGKYKDSIEFPYDNYDLRVTADAVGKNKAVPTKAIEIKPVAFEYDSPTLTGLVATPAIAAGDGVYVSYSFNCPAGTAAHQFALADLVGGQADTVIDDGGSGISGSGRGLLEADGQLFGVEGLGIATCTWSVQLVY